MQDLTVIILTKNEEKNIVKCIESFEKCARRFVIVDSYSTDDTKEKVEKLARDMESEGIQIDFYENAWVDHATQFNWGLDNTHIDSEWIMRIDADEELLPELRDDIENKLISLPQGVNGIVVNRRIIFMGRWIKHGGVYPTRLLRIFRNGHARCEQRIMDEHIVLSDGEIVRFDHDLMDNNTKSLEWWTDKHNWYSGREVKDHLTTNNGINDESLSANRKFAKQAVFRRLLKNNLYYNMPIFMRAHLYYLYRYYFRLGFLDGKEGRIFHFLQAYWYRFLVDSKLYENDKISKQPRK